MNIGKLRHRITLLRQVNEVNDYGASTQTWKRVATVWADVRPLSGREYFSAQQVQSEVTTQIWLRHIEGIKPTMKVKFGKREFEILSVLNTQSVTCRYSLCVRRQVMSNLTVKVTGLKELGKKMNDLGKKTKGRISVDSMRKGAVIIRDKARANAPTLQEMALYSDVFYIGGTKMGALFGECLVIINDELKTDFRYHIKQKGAMLAKGRLLGVQFNALFENDLYLEIGKHENECADILRKGFKDKGYKMYIESPSNQIFPIVDQQTLEKINKNYITTYMFKIDDQHTCIRLVTSWATSKEICEQFIEEL